MENFIYKLKLFDYKERINYNNDKYILELYEFYNQNKKTGSNKELKKIFSLFLKKFNLKNFSILNKNYYCALGYSENEASEKVKNIQSKNAIKRHKKYTKSEVSAQSVWSKKFWLKKGLNDKDAKKKVHELNYSSKEGYTEDEYNLVINKFSNNAKNAHKRGVYIKSYNKISDEEIIFFNWLSTFSKIKHKTLWVNVVNSKLTNKAGYSIDGYLKIKEGLIGIEYDGIYWHKIEKDNIRDKEIFECRNDIIGILRVSSRYFKSTDKEKIKKDILYGINEIKNKKRKKIRYY